MNVDCKLNLKLDQIIDITNLVSGLMVSLEVVLGLVLLVMNWVHLTSTLSDECRRNLDDGQGTIYVNVVIKWSNFASLSRFKYDTGGYYLYYLTQWYIQHMVDCERSCTIGNPGLQLHRLW